MYFAPVVLPGPMGQEGAFLATSGRMIRKHP